MRAQTKDTERHVYIKLTVRSIRLALSSSSWHTRSRAPHDTSEGVVKVRLCASRTAEVGVATRCTFVSGPC